MFWIVTIFMYLAGGAYWATAAFQEMKALPSMPTRARLLLTGVVGFLWLPIWGMAGVEGAIRKMRGRFKKSPDRLEDR